jgi:hypothetical protein
VIRDTVSKFKFLGAAAGLLLTIAAPAADVRATRSNLNPGIVFNAETTYVNFCVGILENEILNNQEEEYILLAPGNGYFAGFNDGMTDAVALLRNFDYSGSAATDFAAIGASLLSAEDAADALGTSYGTGVGTAYQYALVVVNGNPDPTSVGQVAKIKAQHGLADAKATPSTDRAPPAQDPREIR